MSSHVSIIVRRININSNAKMPKPKWYIPNMYRSIFKILEQLTSHIYQFIFIPIYCIIEWFGLVIRTIKFKRNFSSSVRVFVPDGFLNRKRDITLCLTSHEFEMRVGMIYNMRYGGFSRKITYECFDYVS